MVVLLLLILVEHTLVVIILVALPCVSMWLCLCVFVSWKGDALVNTRFVTNVSLSWSSVVL